MHSKELGIEVTLSKSEYLKTGNPETLHHDGVLL